MKALWSNGVHYLQMTSLGSYSMSGRRKEGKYGEDNYISPVVHGAKDWGQKSFKLVWQCCQVPRHWPLLWVLHQSCLLTNYNGVVIKPEAVHRSSGIYHTAKKNSRKPQLGDHLIKAVQPVITSNGVTCLQMMVESRSTSEGKRREGQQEVIPMCTIV